MTSLGWVGLFGGVGLAAGLLAGFVQGAWEGALVCGFVGGVVGAVVGHKAGMMADILRSLAAMAWLDRPVRRPDLWGYPLVCTKCDWRTEPGGPWRIRDCMSPPYQCPQCGGTLSRIVVACPRCGEAPQQRVRWPRDFRQALWGGHNCKACGCSYDKWGRLVDKYSLV